MKKFYDNPRLRAGLSAILTALVSISLAVLGNWDSKQEGFWVKVSVFVVLSIVNLSYVIFCAAQDSKEHALIAELKRENDVFKKAMSGIISISQENSSKINECLHQYLTDGKIDPKVWNYKKACYLLCATIYEFVIKLTKNEKVEISYVKLNENIPDEIQLYAYRNQNNQPPKLLNIPRDFSDKNAISYYDMELFQNHCSETDVLYGSDEINNRFFRTREERERNPKKYKEYVAIPVFCDNKKMVGLLQIACLEDCSLAEDKAILKEIANKFFVPYANLFLLLHKMNKALHLGIDKGGD
ncbi:MAG: hypothetical protein J6Q82_01560 [Clostridia bacterium]|nr:hypothetical protein [Clostridia bacterium]